MSAWLGFLPFSFAVMLQVFLSVARLGEFSQVLSVFSPFDIVLSPRRFHYRNIYLHASLVDIYILVYINIHNNVSCWLAWVIMYLHISQFLTECMNSCANTMKNSRIIDNLALPLFFCLNLSGFHKISAIISMTL